jgi:hypothetical protein
VFLDGTVLLLLAISAGALPSSTIFCCTFLPLLLFGFPSFACFLFPSQAKPVAMKRHRKRGRLKTDTAVKGSMGGLAKEALSCNTCHTNPDVPACPTKQIADGDAIFAEWLES